MNLIFKFTIAEITKFELEFRNYAQFRDSNNKLTAKYNFIKNY